MSMTTVQAAGRLARHLKQGDFTKLTVNEVADVLEAMNFALQQLYSLLPPRFRQTTISTVLQGPTTVSAQVTQGSSDLGNTPFSTADIGKSVQIAGDANWNEINGVDELLDAYLGTTGTKDAIIYHDTALDPSFPFERMNGAPYLTDQRRPLIPYNARAAGLPPIVGEPRYYWIEDLSAALGRQARFVMRMHPAPDQAYNLRVVLAFWATRLTLADLQTPVALYVPDEFYESGFLPIALGHLTISPAWANEKNKPLILQNAADARRDLSGQPGRTDSASVAVGTPAKF